MLPTLWLSGFVLGVRGAAFGTNSVVTIKHSTHACGQRRMLLVYAVTATTRTQCSSDC
jgi:hypothetical protein